jgi:hypothetical protein
MARLELGRTWDRFRCKNGSHFSELIGRMLRHHQIAPFLKEAAEIIFVRVLRMKAASQDLRYQSERNRALLIGRCLPAGFKKNVLRFVAHANRHHDIHDPSPAQKVDGLSHARCRAPSEGSRIRYAKDSHRKFGGGRDDCRKLFG